MYVHVLGGITICAFCFIFLNLYKYVTCTLIQTVKTWKSIFKNTHSLWKVYNYKPGTSVTQCAHTLISEDVQSDISSAVLKNEQFLSDKCSITMIYMSLNKRETQRIGKSS